MGAKDVLGKALEIVTTEAEDARCVQSSFHPTHHHGQHYNSVRCVTDEGSGPAPAASLAELKRRIDEALAPPPPKEEVVEEAAPAKPMTAMEKIMLKKRQAAEAAAAG